MPGRRQAYHSSKEWRIGSWPSLSLRKWRQIGPTARGSHCYSSSRTHHSSKGNSASRLAEMLSGAHRRSVAGESGPEVVAAIAGAAAQPASNFRARRLPAKSFGNGRAAHLEVLLGQVGKE